MKKISIIITLLLTIVSCGKTIGEKRQRRAFLKDSLEMVKKANEEAANAKLMATLPYPEAGFATEIATSFIKGMSNYEIIEVRAAHRKAAKKSYYKVVKVGDAWEVRWAYKDGSYSVETFFNKRKADSVVNDKIEGRKDELNTIALIINSRK
jgi:hypothetical protein